MSIDQGMVSTIQMVAGLFSTIVAVVALAIAFIAERRNHVRFSQQLELAATVAAGQVKPLVTLVSRAHPQEKFIMMKNRGIGPACVTSVKFKKGDKTTRNVRDLFQLPHQGKWENTTALSKRSFYLAPGETIMLAKLTAEQFKDQKISDENAYEIFHYWKQQKTGIEASIEFTDVLGNQQPPYEDILR